MNKKLLSLCIILCAFLSYSQETNVPDDVFENYLETHDADGNIVDIGNAASMGNGIANDGKVTTAKIENVTVLSIDGPRLLPGQVADPSEIVSDATGIQDFIALEELSFERNELTSIDLTQNTALVALSLDDNKLTSIDLTQNTALTQLTCDDNQLTSLDVTLNTQLTNLDCSDNNVTSLDVSQNTLLTRLICYRNELTSVDVTQNTQLTDLSCYDNPIGSLDVTKNLLLEDLSCSDNQLTSLDVTQNSALVYLLCDDNLLTSLDVSQNTALIELYCADNQIASLDLTSNTLLVEIELQDNVLTSLDLRNGNNTNLDVEVHNNPDLYCILVDDASAAYLNSRSWNKDTHSFYSTDCRLTTVSDDAFENYLETHNADGNTVDVGDPSSMGNGVANDNAVTTEKIETVTSLSIARKNISDLTGIADFTALKNLSCGSNSLTFIDITLNTQLTHLYCGSNQLTSLNVSQNTALIEISCFNNPINNLDVTKNILLEELNCVGNQLTSLDVSQNKALFELECYENLLTSLDVSQNTALTYLDCSDNQISSLNLTQNILLDELYCHENVLTYLNIRNGNNTNLGDRSFDITNNPGLTCVAVDDPTYAAANLTDKDVQTVYSTFCSETNVPDDNFEAYLETHNAIGELVAVGDLTSMGNGIANDDYVGTERIKNVTNLDISSQSIADLTGITGFIALEELNVRNNSLTDIDVTKNVALTNLDLYKNSLTSIDISQNVVLRELICAQNSLTSIDLSKNILLTSLNCGENELTSLDVSHNTTLITLTCSEGQLDSLDVTQNILLEQLYCSFNPLGSLDVTQNPLLETLGCSENELTTLDVTQNPNLVTLFSTGNQFASIDVTQNTLLQELDCYGNQMSSIDVTQNLDLVYLYVSDNQLTTLDLSQNIALEELEADDNQLTYLNLKNGNNVSTFSYVNVTNNPNLSCIEVDDVTYSNTNWTDKDAHSFYSIDCRQTYVPDDNFENYLETHDADGNTVSVGDVTSMGNGIADDDNVNTIAIENVTSLILDYLIPAPGQVIDPATLVSDLTGLEDFIALVELDIRFQNISTLDVTGNINLETLTCYNSEVSTLDVSTNTKLEALTLASNKVTTIDISNNTLLRNFLAFDNAISDIDLSTNTLLEEIYLNQNQLSSIDVSNNPLVKRVTINDNMLTNMDLSTNTNLEIVQIQNNQLTTVNIKNGNNGSITYFQATNNPDLTCIEVDDATYSTTNWTNKDIQTGFSEDCYPPVITLTGDTPQTIIFGVGYTELGATTDDGTDVVIDASDFVDAIGSYTIRYNATALSGLVALEVIRVVNVIGCPIYDLPADNFKVEAVSETCIDKNNGMITINATTTLDYETTINGENYNFTSTVTVDNLEPGTYPVCIAIDGNTDCKQCFEIVIEDAESLTGKTTLNTKEGSTTVNVELTTGTSPYTAMINDEVVGVYTTNSFSIDIQQSGVLEIHSSLACEGKLSKTIDPFDEITVAPNPTRGDVILTVPNAEETLAIEIHNALGVLVSSKVYNTNDGKVSLPMESLSAGIYFVRINATTPKTFKIVKQ
ncbi:T9SS type A sorting domain-containing protein [Aquimarina sp. 2304DJ70-9]|uniref:T9SS type A sorting domain-containing protein n=1 Tax=Aquimarina penaris TaxID=3231044 RepID=UPI0034635EDB